MSDLDYVHRLQQRIRIGTIVVLAVVSVEASALCFAVSSALVAAVVGPNPISPWPLMVVVISSLGGPATFGLWARPWVERWRLFVEGLDRTLCAPSPDVARSAVPQEGSTS